VSKPTNPRVLMIISKMSAGIANSIDYPKKENREPEFRI
jgi:hypothetical protein